MSEVEFGTVTVLAAPASQVSGAVDTVAAEPGFGSWVAVVLLGLGILAVLAGGLVLLRRWRGPGGPPPSGPPPPPRPPVGPGRRIRPVRVGISPVDGPPGPAPADQPLAPGRSYLLWLDIGPLPGSATATTADITVAVFDTSPAGPVLTDNLTRELRLGRAAPGRIGFRFGTRGDPAAVLAVLPGRAAAVLRGHRRRGPTDLARPVAR